MINRDTLRPAWRRTIKHWHHGVGSYSKRKKIIFIDRMSGADGNKTGPPHVSETFAHLPLFFPSIRDTENFLS
jgi:hypothetical protein